MPAPNSSGGHILQGATSDELVASQRFAGDDAAQDRKGRGMGRSGGRGRSKRDPSAAPKVTAIRQQVKRAGRYSVYIDDAYAFSLSEGALLDQHIVIGQQVTPQQLAEYKDTSKFDKAYGLTLAYVARRLRSEWELQEYFRRKEIDEDSAERIVERLRGYGYVDDTAFARSWVDNRRAVKQVSRRRLALELRQKRIADDIVRAVLEEDETTDLQTLRALVAKKRPQTRYQDPTKLMQYLARQGYGYDDIKRALSGTDGDE